MSAARTHTDFENNFLSILDEQSPKKINILGGNQKTYFNKNLRKKIFIRPRLKNKANQPKHLIDFANFKRQRNLVANLNKQAKL